MLHYLSSATQVSYSRNGFEQGIASLCWFFQTIAQESTSKNNNNLRKKFKMFPASILTAVTILSPCFNQKDMPRYDIFEFEAGVNALTLNNHGVVLCSSGQNDSTIDMLYDYIGCANFSWSKKSGKSWIAPFSAFYGGGPCRINDSGEAVGTVNKHLPNTTRRPGEFVFSKAAILWVDNKADEVLTLSYCKDILGVMGNIHLVAIAINNSGNIVGMFEWLQLSSAPIPQSHYTPVLFKKDSLKFLPAFENLPGQHSAYPNDINNLDQVIGRYSVTYKFHESAFPVIWEGDQVKRLPALPGFEVAEARAINDRGQTVGHVSNSLRLKTFPVIWEKYKIKILKTLYKGNGRAFDINNSGIVVGTSVFKEKRKIATVWKDDKVCDLNFLIKKKPDTIWELRGAHQINDQGVILGSGYFTYKGKKSVRSFMAVPVGVADAAEKREEIK